MLSGKVLNVLLIRHESVKVYISVNIVLKERRTEHIHFKKEWKIKRNTNSKVILIVDEIQGRKR